MKGWFKVPGIRPDGDRSIEEQMLGLEKALGECKGKTVLDLGCAEGCIAAAFARAGASIVVGVEALQTHVDVARKVCAGLNVDLHCAALQAWMPEHPPALNRFDIVLALGIIHKLENPGAPLQWAADSTNELLCFRGPGREALNKWNGVIKAKYGDGTVHVPTTLKQSGLTLVESFSGVRNEGVQYWRRLG
jgi:2-polyprenyl-3-methyl-5-hydroxy-6-metoxy-1,4-benzoquinol methylase